MAGMNLAESETGIVLRDPLAWADAVRIVETARDAGYGAVFVPEIDSREAFSTLTGYSLVAPGMKVGTGVVTVSSRAPTTTAMAAATVQELSGGRMILGIGAGSIGSAPGSAGSATSRGPLAMTEEYVRVVRGALSGDRVASDVFGVSGFRLAIPLPGGPPPVWLAALGERMLALAGRVADGVILNWCTPERVVAARKTLAESAERSGRDPGDITVAVYVRACLGVQDEVALPPLQAMAGMYAAIPAYGRQMAAMGFGRDAEIAAAAHRAGTVREVP